MRTSTSPTRRLRATGCSPSADRARPAGSARETEASRVFGCAPLILFLYSFGTQRSAPASIEVARKLFWYVTEISGPYAAGPPLTDLLQRWGVR